MRFNPRGFWRVLVVVYGLTAAGICLAGGLATYDRIRCHRRAADLHAAFESEPEVRPRVLSAAEAKAEGLPPPFRWQSSPVVATSPKKGYSDLGFVPACQPTRESVLATLAGLVAAFVLLFGGAFVVRWVFRGFAQS